MVVKIEIVIIGAMMIKEDIDYTSILISTKITLINHCCLKQLSLLAAVDSAIFFG
jgi:hypothetical protein